MKEQTANLPSILVEAQDAHNQRWEKVFTPFKNTGLAVVGVAAFAQEEFKKLAQYGEKVEHDLKERITNYSKKSYDQAQHGYKTLKHNFTMETVLARFNIPTNKDLQELSKKLDLLTERVESLSHSK